MNKQEMFTKVWRGLEAQKWEKSRADKIGCLYRGPNGMKCAAGHLIPDEKYKPKIEGDPILLLLSQRIHLLQLISLWISTFARRKNQSSQSSWLNTGIVENNTSQATIPCSTKQGQCNLGKL